MLIRRRRRCRRRNVNKNIQTLVLAEAIKIIKIIHNAGSKT